MPLSLKPIAGAGGRKPSPTSILSDAIGKYKMKFSDYLTGTLLLNRLAAKRRGWSALGRGIVIANAVLLLGSILYAAVKKEEFNAEP